MNSEWSKYSSNKMYFVNKDGKLCSRRLVRSGRDSLSTWEGIEIQEYPSGFFKKELLELLKDCHGPNAKFVKQVCRE